MKNYINYCTEEQTKKAFKLGAPIKHETELHSYCEPWSEFEEYYIKDTETLIKPTTQQMIGWLEEKDQTIEVCRLTFGGDWAVFINNIQEVGKYFNSRKEAELYGIDSALIYLEKGLES